MASVYAGQTRKAHARGEPASLLVHEDVLVFQKPQMSRSSGKLKGLQRELECSSDALSSKDPWVRGQATGSPS